MKKTIISLCAFAGVLSAFALDLEFGTLGTGDGGHGFGILAEYGEGGPKTLTITRTTLPGNPPPSYWVRWGNLCNLTVYGPDGFRATYLEMGDQTEATKTYTVKIPEGKAGVWRFSVSGGRCPAGRFVGDTFKVTVPDSETWGVRGEKILKLVGEKIPAKMYMAFLPQNDKFYLTGDNVSWTMDGRAIDGRTGRSAHGSKTVLAQRGTGEILEIATDAGKKWMTLFTDGLPSTLSPTPEMARRLKGGAVACSDGLYLEGPLQAKLRDYALRTLKGADFDVSAKLGDIKDAWNVRSFTNQVTDVADPCFGFCYRPKCLTGVTVHPIGHDFFHYANNGYQSGMFSTQAAEHPGEVAFKNRALLSGFCDLWNMDACGIIRNSSYPVGLPLTGGRIDCATMFEICVGICRGYAKLKPLLNPEEEKLYREAIFQMLIKQQGFMCYQSNQFMHILEGFNEVFCATGDPIIERCLRMQLMSFIRNDFHGKHGQTGAGFYSEEYGPDGNYDQMSLRPMSVIYYSYSKQPGADPELVKMMRESIEKNLDFRMLFAIPDPATELGKPYQLAYAMNHRTDGPTHFDSHFGLHICSNEFAKAYTMLCVGAKAKDPSKLVPLPCETPGFTADLPGFAAVRRGNFYGVQFYKVYDENADGFLGPLLLWHTKAGMGLCGVKHSYGKRHSHWFGPEMDEQDLTFATVYGQLDGKLYVPSRRMKKTLDWKADKSGWTVTGTAYQPPKARNVQPLARGTIAWTTEFVSADAVDMTIKVDFPDLKDAVVNIPMLKQNDRTVWTHGGWRPWTLSGNRLVQKSRSGVFTITFPSGVKAWVDDNLYCTRGWAMALRLQVPASGEVKVRLEGSALSSLPFKDGDRVAFWGDSITHGGTYTKMLSDFYLTRYPEQTIRFYNAGVGGDNAGDALSRFNDDILRRQPTAVTFMFGMNDSWRGNYAPDKLADPKHVAELPALEKRCFTEYTNNMTRLVKTVSRQCRDARKIFLTPTPTDDTCRPKDDGKPPVPPLHGTVGALGRFADFEKASVGPFNAELIDFLDPFTNLVAREQAKDPAFTLLRRDRVHPMAPGHLFMTYEFLRQQGVNGTVSDVTIQAKEQRAVAETLKNATVSNIAWDAAKSRLTFSLLEQALPWPIQADAVEALGLVPVVDELNREILTVRQLPEGTYALKIDGAEVGRYSAAELANGVNLAMNEKTPQFKQAAALEAKNAERCQIEREKLRMFAASRWILRKFKLNPDDLAAVQKYYDGLDEEKRKGYFESRFPAYIEGYKEKAAIEADQEARYDELLKMRKPVAHEYEVTRVEK